MKNNIKILLMLLCVLAILVAVPACSNDNKNPDVTTPSDNDTTTPPPDNGKVILTLNETNIVIGIGETKRLSAKSSLTGMETSGVLWISDNPSVATVDTSGNVKGVSDGSANITVSTIDGTSTAICAVQVTSKVTGVNITETQITLDVGDSKELEYQIIPENAANSGVTWSSSDDKIATVSENGVITAISDGNVSIQIKTDEGSITDYCSVTVITPVKGISFTGPTEWNVNKGVDFYLYYTISPANATNKTVTWSSKDDTVAIVSSEGNVTPVGTGSTTITVTTSNGYSASCVVNVKSPVSGVSISQQEIHLTKGKEWTLGAEVLPADASNSNVTWRTSDSSIATVTQSGIVSARKVGEVVITVVTVDGNKSAECTVFITNPLTSITFDKTTLNMTVFDAPVTLIPTYDPIDADDIDATRWASNNTKVATVDANGVVTPVGDGIAEITLSTENGVFASCTVTVTSSIKPVSSITVEKRYVTLRAGEKHTPTITVLPADASDKTYTLSSADKSVVRVNEDGSLTAISKGTAIITVSSVQNPEISETFIVDVKDLTQEEINSSITKYYDALDQENTRHLAALASIDSRFAYLTELKNVLDTDYAGFNESVYNSQRSAIEMNLTDYYTALTEAENASDMEQVNYYTNLIAQEQDKLTQLDSKWTLYSSQLQIYNEDSVKYKSEIDAENKLNADNIAKIKSDYAFILPYLPTT